MGLLLRLGPNIITGGTFITLGSSYYTCAFYKPHYVAPTVHINLVIQICGDGNWLPLTLMRMAKTNQHTQKTYPGV